LKGINNSASKFDGMLLFQRRWNKTPITIGGSSSAPLILNGIVYSKWAPVNLSRPGTYTSQFITGSMQVAGAGGVVIDPTPATGKPLKTANQVFLVE
jgi:hypothetical protein